MSELSDKLFAGTGGGEPVVPAATGLAGLIEQAVRLRDSRREAQAVADDLKVQASAAETAALNALMQEGLASSEVVIDGVKRRFAATPEMYASLHVEEPADILALAEAFGELGAGEMVKQSPVNAQSLGAWLREREVAGAIDFDADDYSRDTEALFAYLAEQEKKYEAPLMWFANNADLALRAGEVYALAEKYNLPLAIASRLRVVNKIKASVRKA